MAKHHEVVIVGGGFRTVNFLASAEALPSRDMAVLERGGRVGPGAFEDYIGTSTSTADRFVAGIRPNSAWTSSRQLVEAWSRNTDTAVPLVHIGMISEKIGEDLESTGAAAFYTATEVVEVALYTDHVEIVCAEGQQFSTDHVVLATGREERPHPALLHMKAPVILSSDFISRAQDSTMAELVRNLDGPIAIAGGSHSAFTALDRALALRNEVGRTDIQVGIIHRRGVRLHYPSIEAFHAEHDPEVEQPLEALLDMCPATGQINRDSGLRGHSRDLLSALRNYEILRASIHQESIDTSPRIRSAALIIQALGYHARSPRIRATNGAVREPGSSRRLYALPDGSPSIHLPGSERLSVLRVEPTPTALRDHAIYGSNTNRLLTERISRALARQR